MLLPARSLLLLFLFLLGSSSAFLSRTSTTRTSRWGVVSVSSSLCGRQRRQRIPGARSEAGTLVVARMVHPAVEAWPERYASAGGTPGGSDDTPPRAISDVFDVHAATDRELEELDVGHWPTWTTADKPKWGVGNLVADKEMPYGELSYMIRGKLEIVPRSTGVPVVVGPGDLVTFPEGFVASWKVLEELTWHYYLY